MDWQNAQPTENHGVKIPSRWLHLYYYEALNILFRFENALRVFVYVILKKELGGKWDTAAIEKETTIRTETRKRIAQARDHGYLGEEVTSPMMYLSSGELIQILTSEAYWKYFAPYFKASKQIVQTKLSEIGTVRNALAHFRPIKQDDVDLIKQNSKHVLIEIERILISILSINEVVPTNSVQPWYKGLKPIGGKYASTSLYSSRDGRWVRVEFSYATPTLQKDVYGETFAQFKVAKLLTSEILKLYPSITESCIYVSEAGMWGQWGPDQTIVAPKSISFVFASDALDRASDAIVEATRDIALKVEAETALLLEDSLARGQLLASESANAISRVEGDKKTWNFSVDALKTPLAEADAVEYWGERSHYVSDFVAGATRYPWMSGAVASGHWFE